MIPLQQIRLHAKPIGRVNIEIKAQKNQRTYVITQHAQLFFSQAIIRDV